MRGAAHTPDLGVALIRGASVFALEDRGFVVTMPGRGIWLLAATDEHGRAALLWYGLASCRPDPRIEIDCVSGRQQWALEVFLAARLSFSSYGAIGTRGASDRCIPISPARRSRERRPPDPAPCR